MWVFARLYLNFAIIIVCHQRRDFFKAVVYLLYSINASIKYLTCTLVVWLHVCQSNHEKPKI